MWLEITNLIIPEQNDDPTQLREMCDWICENLGNDVPLHFSAFHPDYRMMDTPPTPHETLIRAWDIARDAGLKYAYVGNVLDPRRDSTYCPDCNRRLIERHWHDVREYALDQNRCRYCGHEVAGHFGSEPGHWGTRRLPVDPASLLRMIDRGDDQSIEVAT